MIDAAKRSGRCRVPAVPNAGRPSTGAAGMDVGHFAPRSLVLHHVTAASPCRRCAPGTRWSWLTVGYHHGVHCSGVLARIRRVCSRQRRAAYCETRVRPMAGPRAGEGAGRAAGGAGGGQGAPGQGAGGCRSMQHAVCLGARGWGAARPGQCRARARCSCCLRGLEGGWGNQVLHTTIFLTCSVHVVQSLRCKGTNVHVQI